MAKHIGNTGLKKLLKLIKTKMSGYLPLSGGIINGTLVVGNITLRTDIEGGNILITSPNKTIWEIDAYDENLRIFNTKGNLAHISFIVLNGETENGIKLKNYKDLLKFRDWKMYADSAAAFYLFPPDNNYAIGFGVFDSIWTLCPHKSGHLNLGSPNHRWANSYFTVSPNINSDRNKKKDIKNISDQYIEFFKLLIPVSFKIIDGTSNRIHIGFISQDVEEAMEKVGLTDLDFAGFCKDIDENGNEIYSLRYEEFIALNTAAIQRQESRIDNLERRIIELENR